MSRRDKLLKTGWAGIVGGILILSITFTTAQSGAVSDASRWMLAATGFAGGMAFGIGGSIPRVIQLYMPAESWESV